MLSFEQRSNGYIEDIDNYLASKLPNKKTPPAKVEKPTAKKVKQARELNIKVISQLEWEKILNYA